MDPNELAQAVARSMFARDSASQSLGMRILEVRAGYARMSMVVTAAMLNGHQVCHGGFLFTLADSAFAFACNSYNLNTVASGATVDFLAPGREGDELLAEAQEQSLSGRTGVYDVSVTNQRGEKVAVFRGRSYRIKGEVIPATGGA
ncbi:MAG: hydroxyphenylacetyl-CoA thioesterase PaaI [Burkholderiales bacterium]